VIVAGFGFRASATVQSLRSAFDVAAKGHVVTALATADDKAQVAAFKELAQSLSLPIHPVDTNAIKTAETLTQSPRVQLERDTGSLAEAAALSAAGPGAQLISPRHISPDRQATCAIAIGGQT
jgi:cobalt-precorrin 5A hydrolase